MKKTLLIVLALLIAGIAAFYLLRSEKHIIKKQFRGIAECVSKESGEGNIAMAAKMMSLGNYLTESVVLGIRDLPMFQEMTSEEIVSLATRGRGFIDELKITIVDVETDILSKEKARSRCTAKVRLRSKSKEYDYDELRTFSSDLVKIEGKWRFASFKEDELIKK